jgi:hypothetical protein
MMPPAFARVDLGYLPEPVITGYYVNTRFGGDGLLYPFGLVDGFYFVASQGDNLDFLLTEAGFLRHMALLRVGVSV